MDCLLLLFLFCVIIFLFINYLNTLYQEKKIIRENFISSF